MCQNPHGVHDIDALTTHDYISTSITNSSIPLNDTSTLFLYWELYEVLVLLIPVLLSLVTVLRIRICAGPIFDAVTYTKSNSCQIK